jgi:hypothetical protein
MLHFVQFRSDQLSDTYADTYGFDLQTSGAMFTAIIVGIVLFTVVAINQESLGRLYLPEKQRAILDTPEGRLYFACVESVLL